VADVGAFAAIWHGDPLVNVVVSFGLASDMRRLKARRTTRTCDMPEGIS
jgi:hypothetical protein